MTEINRHDVGFKAIFADAAMIESILRRFAPADIVAEMDFSSLEPVNIEHLADDGRMRRNDSIWRVKLRGSFCYLFFMLEFQSQQNWWMATRILTYTALLWEDIIKARNLRPGDSLPPVFPLVLYDGSPAWKAPVGIADLQHGIKKSLLPFQPRQDYFLLDMGRISEDALAGDDLASLMIRLENAREPEDLVEILGRLCKLLPPSSRQHLHRAFIGWLASCVFRHTEVGNKIIHCETLQEAYTMLADVAPRWEESFVERGIAIGLDKGRKEGRNEGIAIGLDKGRKEGRNEGIAIGRKNTLFEILADRFGHVPEDLAQALDNAPASVMDTKLVLAATKASSLDDFKKDFEDIGRKN